MFRDGTVVEGAWTKSSVREREHFVDAEGKPIALNGGTTWIEIVPKESLLEY